jgi:carbon-monoxide dehydrogenase large subunit
VTLRIGTQSNGQGHATAYAQFVSEKLEPRRSTASRSHQGDTDQLKSGGGTGGSRSIPLGGVSAARAGEDLAGKIRRLAADELEASAADIELVGGTARIVGTDRSHVLRRHRQGGEEAGGPEGFGEFVQNEATYPNGSHICEVEIDPQTGATQIVATRSSTISARR